MHFQYFIFCVLLFYNTEAKLREVVCPDYCKCDVFRNFKRAVCQSKKLVSAEIGIPSEVEIFDLSYNQISELGNRVFADDGLTELKLLNLSNNKISQIHMFAFDGIKNLKSLDLSFNIIEYFLEQWFSSWQNLQELYLQGNNLVLINKQPILNLPSLKILDLSQSKIEHFNPNVFTLLPNLEILDISSNYIQRLNVELIVPLTNLQLLVAKNNILDCKENVIPPLRQLIRKKSITYVGPCIRKVRRTRPNRPNIDGNILIPNESKQEGGNKEFEKVVTAENNLEIYESVAAGYTGVPDDTGVSEKNLLNEDLDKITDKLARYGNNENYKIEEKTDKVPDSEIEEDKNTDELTLTDTNEDAEVLEKFDTVQNSGKVGGVNNKTDDTDKLEISSNLGTVKDTEILGGSKNFNNSNKFQKMKMETLSPINKIDNVDLFTRDDKLEVSQNSKTEMMKDDLINDFKKFLQYERLKKVSTSDSKAKVVRETPITAAETPAQKATVPVPARAEINSWMVDDEKNKSDGDSSKNNVETCNGTKRVNFNNVLDKMAMEIIEVSPSLILVLFTLFGIMLGLVIGCTVQIKDIKNVKKPDFKCFDIFKRRKPKTDDNGKNEMDQNEIKIPITDEEVLKMEDNQQNESAMPGDEEESDDCDICEEEREILNNRKDKNKKRPKSPFEDRTFLLDNELVQDDSTPMLGKKEFSSTAD